jgi:hypothetical protein
LERSEFPCLRHRLIQAGIGPQSFEGVHLSRETLRELARLDGSILVTVYAPDREVVQEERV